MSDDPLDKCRRILRGETEAEQATLRSDNQSGCPGVYRVPSGTWRAELTVGSVKHNLGTFANIDDAIAARREAEDRMGID